MAARISGTSTTAGRAVAIATAIVAAAVVALTVAPPRAAAAPIPTALGIPCTPGPGEVQRCTGSIDTRVPSFDGVPLDVNLTFPPAAQDGPHPLIVYLHGWGGSKEADGDPGYKTRASVTTSDGKTFNSKRVRVRELLEDSAEK